jgi:hypothetical protein
VRRVRDRVQATVTIDLPLAAVWERMRDLTKPHFYVDGILRTRLDSPNATGVGASRTVFPKRLPPLEETVTAWDEGRGFTLRLHRGERPMAPFQEIEFVYELRADGDARTTFVAAMAYTLGFGPLGPVLNAALRPILRSNTARVADNLKRYYETGQPTNPDYRPS